MSFCLLFVTAFPAIFIAENAPLVFYKSPWWMRMDSNHRGPEGHPVYSRVLSTAQTRIQFVHWFLSGGAHSNTNRPSYLVEDAGFEPATFCVQGSCASKLRQSPMWSLSTTSAVSKREHTKVLCGCSRCTRASRAHPAQPFPWLRQSGVQGHPRSGAGSGDRTRDFRVGNALLCPRRTYPSIRQPCAGVPQATGVGASRAVVYITTSGLRHPPVACGAPARRVVTTKRVCGVATLAQG